MVEEFFYAVTLDGEKASFTWNGEQESKVDDNGPAIGTESKLLIRQILLGPTAGDETHVIEVEAVSCRDKVKVPIAVLKKGETNQLRVSLDFPDSPVIFTLAQGKGPVYLLGQHLEQIMDDLEQDLEEEEADEDEVSDDEDVPAENIVELERPSKKAKLETNNKNHKKAKASKK